MLVHHLNKYKVLTSSLEVRGRYRATTNRDQLLQVAGYSREPGGSATANFRSRSTNIRPLHH